MTVLESWEVLNVCRCVSMFDIVSVTVFVPSDALQHALLTCAIFSCILCPNIFNFCDNIMFSSVLQHSSAASLYLGLLCNFVRCH